jgi:thiamine transport system permease protein
MNNRPYTTWQRGGVDASKFACLFVLCLVLAGLLPLFYFALSQASNFKFDAYIWKVLWFTLKQAFLSAAISTFLGLLLARALNKGEFPGKQILINVLALPQALPAIVVVLSITTLFGTRGWFGGWLQIYGLTGILVAHIFFNMPLATRLFSETLRTIPLENIRLANQLCMNKFNKFMHIEWPIIRRDLPRIFGLIFLLCAASFVVVLTLGGPSSTTLEVAIYQSLRQDFDVPRALSLSSLQVILCALLVLLSGKMVLRHMPTQSYSLKSQPTKNMTSISDLIVISTAFAIVGLPLVALIFSGISYLNFNFQALITSLFIGTCSSIGGVALAWPLARHPIFVSQLAALATLLVPPAVLATGWFIALQRLEGSWINILCVITLNALLALPFAMAALAPGFSKITNQYEMICRQLNVVGWQRFWVIDFPIMRRPLAQAALLSFVMALGDLTAITLLGSQGLVTLPSLIQNQMGHYRGNDAGGTALILTALCYILTTFASRLGKSDD